MRRLRPLVPVLAGLAAACGQAPWGLWWLALPAFALGIAACARARWPALAGLAFGVSHFGLALVWIMEPFRVDPGLTGWLAPVALAGVAFGFGGFWSVAAWMGVRVLGGAMGVAVAIAGAELLRSYLFTGFPWALVGHALANSPALPAASFLGAHGFGLAVLIGAASIVAARPVTVAGGIALWAAPVLVGLALPPAPPATGPVIRMVQPNAPQHLKWDPDLIGTYWRRSLAETAAEGDPAAIVWPETSLPALIEQSDDLRPIVAAAAGGVPVMIGAQRYGADGRARNTMVLIEGTDGDIAARYDKHRLVPFGEFLPLPGLFDALGMGPLAANLAGGYAPGDGPHLVDVPGVGPVLPLICYEAIFPQLLRATDRPRAVFHLTNDAWFGIAIGPQQHLLLARLRAAESGLPVLRAANTGISAAIDARGRVLASLPMNVAGHLDAALPAALPRTLYGWTGDWAALAAIVLLMLVLAARRTRRRGPRAPGVAAPAKAP